LQGFKVDELLAQCRTPSFNGAEVVDRLSRAIVYSRNERIHVVKVLAKYLMFNCAK